MTALLTVKNLKVAYPGRRGPADAVRGVTFTLGHERLGIVGAVGSCRRIPHMSDADVALELQHVLLLEHIAHQT